MKDHAVETKCSTSDFHDYLHIYPHQNQIKDPVQEYAVGLSLICMIKNF